LSNADDRHDANSKHYAVLIYDVTRLIRKRFAERIRDIGFTELRWRIIAHLMQRPGLNQTELADLLEMEKAPLGNAVDKLRLEGWLRREADPKDKRAKCLFLTEQCNPVVEQMQTRYSSLLQEVTGDIPQQMLEDSLQTLGQIAQQLREQPAPPMAIPYNTLSKTIEVGRLLKKRFNAPIRELGFTPSQWLVLVTVARFESQTQTAIAGMLDLSKAPLGQLLDELEKNDWIARETDPADRRAKRLRLTDGARDLLTQQSPRFSAIHDDVVGRIDARALAALSDTLHLIRGKLKNAAACNQGTPNE
jgi:DNA-binding MarR family transcriptional regulator